MPHRVGYGAFSSLFNCKLFIKFLFNFPLTQFSFSSALFSFPLCTFYHFYCCWYLTLFLCGQMKCKMPFQLFWTGLYLNCILICDLFWKKSHGQLKISFIVLGMENMKILVLEDFTSNSLIFLHLAWCWLWDYCVLPLLSWTISCSVDVH